VQLLGDAAPQHMRHFGIEVTAIAFAELDANGHSTHRQAADPGGHTARTACDIAED
jgi:hypothetical protein